MPFPFAPFARAIAVTVTFAALASACKTTDQDVSTEQVLEKADMVPPPQEKDDMGRVPLSLWSPTQRQAAAMHYFLVAEYIALKERSGKKALPLFETSYGLDPNPFLGGKMLSAKAAAGQRAEAMLEARKMVLLYPRDPQLRLLYGSMLAASGDVASASEQLEKCVELDPQREQAYLELIELYQVSKQGPKALVVARELVRNVPSSIAGWSILSRLLVAQSQYKEALVPARRAWEMQSSNPHLAQMYAIVLQLNGKTSQAIRIYEQLYRMDPTDEELTARMVDLYREIGNLENALELLDELSRQDSKGRPAVQMQRALLLWELKRFKEASELLSRLSKEHPDSDRLKYLAAVGLERLESWDEALKAYAAVPASSSFRYQAEVRTIVIYKNRKLWSEALVAAERLVAAHASDWEAYGLAAGIHSDAGRFEDAIRLASDGYAKFQDKPRLLFLKGVYQEKAGDRDGCIETMREVLVKDPTNSSAYNYLGYLFVEKGENLDEAESLIKKAIELKPDDGFYLDSLGWLYFQRGELQKARELLEKASKIEPKEGVILEHLGDVKRQLGDLKGGVELYRKALEGSLEDKDRQRIEKKLKELAK
jgi:tetratricopeptide (TPR) repeat protein